MYIPTIPAHVTELECINEYERISIFIRALSRIRVSEMQVISGVFQSFEYTHVASQNFYLVI